MASPNPDSFTPEINSVQKQIASNNKALSSSVTGSSSVLTPTYSDISRDKENQSLETQLRTLQKKQLTAEWYGDDQSDNGSEGGANSGIIGSVLGTLQKPLYGVVSGVKSLMGETPTGKEDFSDLLKEHNVPYPIAAPLGFALDVTADPVNWLTAGTGALLPRIGAGVVKAGVEGGLLGAKSSILEKAAGAAKYIPGLGGREGSVASSLSQKANDAWETYKGLTGIDPLANIDKTGIGLGASRTSLNDWTKRILTYVPKGDDIYKSMYYSSNDWVDQWKLMDAVERNSAKTIEDIRSGDPELLKLADNPDLPSGGGQSALSHPSIRANFEWLKDVPEGSERDAFTDQLNKMADDAATLSSKPSIAMAATPEEATMRLLKEAQGQDELRDLFSRLKQEEELAGQDGATGIKTYDKASKWARSVKVKIGDKEIKPINEFLNVYHAFIGGVFKPAHSFLSPATAAMNYLSAWPMYKMMGGETGPWDFYKEYNRAYGALVGLDPRGFILDKFLTNDDVGAAWKDVLDKYPGTLRKTFGVGPAWFQGHALSGSGDMQEMVNAGKAAGYFTGESDDEIVQMLQQFNKEMAEEMRNGNLNPEKSTSFFSKLRKTARAKGAKTQSTLVEDLRKRLGGDMPAEADLPAGFTARDYLQDNPLLDRIDNWIKTKSDEGNKAASVYQLFMQKARAGYEHQDQAARMAISTLLTQTGLSENGIKVMSRFSPFNRETDLMEKYVRDGKTMYRIAPLKAISIANDAMINYAAMPAAIRMLRSVPIIGAPFSQFTYGLGLRAIQTAAYNPSMYNKISFGIKAASGNKSPLERAALNPAPGQPNYYGWYNDPSMFRMPFNFFDNYPLYLNLANALPYYSLNIFQPSSRTYSQTLPNTVVQTLDRSPILKDPIGSTIFDYFVLPSILAGTGDRPENSMGAPLYPTNATTGDKAFYMGRGVADAFTPNVVSIAGVAAPQSIANDLPGYRTRQFANAKDARNTMGIPGEESAASRSIRALLAYMGLPFQRLDTTFAAQDANPQGGQ